MLSEFKSEFLQQKWIKIAPHVVDTLLIVSGITLVIQGSWLSTQPDWLVGKLLVLCVYIGLGILTMRKQGTTRWLAFTATVACYIYIMVVAISKNPLFFIG
jgi:uncharacterized membrane protein SirB2